MNIEKIVDNRLGIYYGWVIVGVTLVSFAFWFGIRTSFSVFYVALLEEFGWDRADSAGVQSAALICYTLLSPAVGVLIDRFGPRRVMIPGILLLAAGLLLCFFIETLGQFYLFFGIIAGSGNTCIGVISYSVILAHWFEKKRGMASGIAASGIGIGTFTLVPMCQHFISALGWRMTFVLLGALVLMIVFPLNAVFLRHKPRELGLFIDGRSGGGAADDTDPGGEALVRPAADWTIRRALGSVHFWALLAFPFLSASGLFIILVHNVTFLVDHGVDKMAAAYMFAMAAVFSTLSRIFWGWLSDRSGREITFTTGAFFLCLGAGSLLMYDAAGTDGFVYTFFIFFGMGWGVLAPMFMAVAADLFKGRAFGLIFGFVEACIGAAGALGSWAAGLIFDITRSYRMAFTTAIAGFILSCIFVWIAAPRKADRIRNRLVV
jgi:MFS family permease